MKLRFFFEITAAELSKLHCLMSTKHSEEKSVHWKIYNVVQTFPHFDPKKPRIQQKCFGMAVKIAFFVSIKYFQVKSIDKMNTNLSIFLGFEQKKFRSLANLFRHTCQNCFSTVQQTLRGKIILVKSIHFCPYFTALSRKRSSLANSIQHSCQVCISRVQQTLWGKSILLKMCKLVHLFGLWAEDGFILRKKT